VPDPGEPIKLKYLNAKLLLPVYTILTWTMVFLNLISIPVNLLAQKNNYFATDSSMNSGVRLIDGSDVKNARVCQVSEKGKTVEYTPYDIKEYGFKDGRVYVSKEIWYGDSSRRVFLQRLVKGPASLYYYKDKKLTTYFFENDNTGLVEIRRNGPQNEGPDYRDKLYSFISDCQYIEDATRLAAYSRFPLSRLVERYNTCKPRPFPFFKYGIYAGIELSWLKAPPGIKNKYFKEADFNCDAGLVIGVFIDQPILASDFSFLTEVYFTKNGYSSNFELYDKEIDILINTKSVNVPLLCRYTFPLMKFQPYVNMGVIYAWQFEHTCDTYATTVNEVMVDIEILNEPSPVAVNQFGISGGTGLQYDLTCRLRLYFDISYNLLYAVPNESYRKNELKILAGISF
jgi:hypothetical protein